MIPTPHGILAACLFATAALPAQERIRLDGTWEVAPVAADGMAGAWQPIEVPSAFETALGVRFDGVARYRRTLTVPRRDGQQVRVEFAAVATHATVFCNGKQVGEHLGGWTPFRVDLTEAVRADGTDLLEVLVDERVGHNTQGFLPIVQPHFGGIWQSVTLCLDTVPQIDRLSLFAFGSWAPVVWGNPPAHLDYEFAVLPAGQHKVAAIVELLDADPSLATVRHDVVAGQRVRDGCGAVGAKPWSPTTPHLHTLRIRLVDGERELDRIEQRIGFRALQASGTQVLWNGAPLQMRGILHWGYSPPHLAPPIDPAFWREQLLGFRARGFNTVKCCLWVPPRCVYELADELGLLIWQEYPTWHPQMDQAHKQELLREYGEFFAHDRNHPAVAFRSITCETGHGADLDVVKALYEACKAAVPDTLVVDDSSWIGWQRISDFWDEHPYGNNSWLPGRLAEFQRHIEQHGQKPLLLGECIAADTWVDSAAWRARHGDAESWWRPDCWRAQQDAEKWLVQAFGEATLRSLRPQSLDFAMRNRQFQIERLRLSMPDAGYVVSVARDFGKARMGLIDDLDRMKWPASAFAWHGDTMLCLDAAWNARALSTGAAPPQVRIAHSGVGALRGELRLASDAADATALQVAVQCEMGAVGAAVSLPALPALAPGDAPRRVRYSAELAGSHRASSHWDVWVLPPFAPSPTAVTHTTALTPALLDALEAGANVVLHAGAQPGSLRTEAMWSLRGAPFAPPHALHQRVPAELLLELSSFDLESGRVMPWDHLRDEFDPVLAFWETHDIPEVRFHLLVGDTRVGKGRLLVTALTLDPATAVGGWLRQQCALHLQHGPAPQRALSASTLGRLRAQLAERRIDLGVWRFRTDPGDEGRAANWQASSTDASAAPWRELQAGSHWENQAEDLKHYTGVAWYRIDVPVPAEWQGLAARAVFDGIDDSGELWCNGELVASFGDAATKTSIWLQRQVAELGTRLQAGKTNTLVLRVVDHAGAGGLWKPACLTTGPTEPPLLH